MINNALAQILFDENQYISGISKFHRINRILSVAINHNKATREMYDMLDWLPYHKLG